MARAPINILFLCTGNSARSILAEALLDRHGAGRFCAFSAGSVPKGAVHSAALALLDSLGFETRRLRSKSWDEFATPGAPDVHAVITVCDNAADEICPIWPGRPVIAHWGIDDPAAVEGDGQPAAFAFAFRTLQERIAKLVLLPVEEMDSASLGASLAEIGAARGRESALA